MNYWIWQLYPDQIVNKTFQSNRIQLQMVLTANYFVAIPILCISPSNFDWFWGKFLASHVHWQSFTFILWFENTPKTTNRMKQNKKQKQIYAQLDMNTDSHLNLSMIGGWAYVRSVRVRVAIVCHLNEMMSSLNSVHCFRFLLLNMMTSEMEVISCVCIFHFITFQTYQRSSFISNVKLNCMLCFINHFKMFTNQLFIERK